MKVRYVTKEKNLSSRCVLCLGVFDGLHLGHQYLIRKAREFALAHNLCCAILTFRPHPQNILNPKNPIKMLGTFRQRLDLLESLGVDLCLVRRFNKRFAQLSPKEFVEKFLVKILRPPVVIVGCDFRFGRNLKGNVAVLENLAKQNGFKLEVVSAQKKAGAKISSSFIRNLLEIGRIEEANRLLGRPYAIKGKVISGKKLGRSIGYPTVNIKYNPKVILPRGIFSGFININTRKYKAAIFIGFKSGLRAKSRLPTLEAHIFGFRRNIYGRSVSVLLIRKIRKDKKFRTLNSLKSAIKKDIEKAKKHLKSY